MIGSVKILLRVTLIFSHSQAREAVDFSSGAVTVAKKWRQVQLAAVAGLLACSFWAVPSADAVDALKTCTCLLRECRFN